MLYSDPTARPLILADFSRARVRMELLVLVVKFASDLSYRQSSYAASLLPVSRRTTSGT
jgi:hypothetical protein